jgi:hypothetical protein
MSYQLRLFWCGLTQIQRLVRNADCGVVISKFGAVAEDAIRKQNMTRRNAIRMG